MKNKTLLLFFTFIILIPWALPKNIQADVNDIINDPNVTLYIRGMQSEVSSVTNGATVTPTKGPNGTLRISGTGGVRYEAVESGTGVAFDPGGPQNTNSANYRFPGSIVGNLINNPSGEISFTLKSKYSIGERSLLPWYNYRYVFTIKDDNSDVLQFIIGTHASTLGYFLVVTKYGNIIKNFDSTLFGKDSIAKIKVSWSNNTCSFFVNDILANGITCNGGLGGSFGNSSLLTFGSHRIEGFYATDDLISEFIIRTNQTGDTSPPVISNVNSSSVTSASALITWTTNENSDTQVFYGTKSNSLSQSTTLTDTNPMVSNHSAQLTSLTSNTDYYYSVRSRDASGNVSIGETLSFKTAIITDTTAPIISGVTVSPGTNSANISWTTNETSDTQVEYGLTPSLGQSTSLIDTGASMKTSHTIDITSLTGSATYYYKVKSRDEAGNLTSSSVASFSTLGTVPAGQATGNGIVIKEYQGQAQTNRTFTISRVFKQGDIPNFPKARIGGSTIPTQADVKNRWPDGSVKHTMISFVTNVPANSAVNVDFVNQASCNCGTDTALNQSQIASKLPNTSMVLTPKSGASTPSGTVNPQTMVNNGHFRYWLSGPIVTQVIIEDRTPAQTYDIGHIGTNGSTYKSFHPMFIATMYPGNEPTKVEFIGENAWANLLQNMDYGLTLTLNGTEVYNNSNVRHEINTRWRKTYWTPAEPTKLHIDYNLKYLTESKAILNYDTSIQLSSQAIQDALSSNVVSGNQCGYPTPARYINPASYISWNEVVATGMNDIGGSAQICKGMPAPGLRPELGIIPQWYINFLYGMSSTHSLAPRLIEPMIGNAEAATTFRIFFRENLTNRNYVLGQSVNAFGKFLSQDARPTMQLLTHASVFKPEDGVKYVGPINFQMFPGTNYPTSSVHPEAAHYPGMFYIPYLITGDYYFLENLYASGSWAIGVTANWDGYQNNNPVIHGIMTRTEIRGIAWAVSQPAEAGFIAPDVDAEKSYFKRIIDLNIGVWEGIFNVTNGAFYNGGICSSTQGGKPFNRLTETNPWCYGRYAPSGGATSDASGFGAPWGSEYSGNKTNAIRNQNPLSFIDIGNLGSAICEPGGEHERFVGVGAVAKPWMMALNYIQHGHMEEMGYQTTALRKKVITPLLNILTNPILDPRLSASYVIPGTPKQTPASCPTFGAYQTWQEFRNSFPQPGAPDPLGNPKNLWDELIDGNYINGNNYYFGYSHVSKAAASFLPGVTDGNLSGDTAWTTIKTGMQRFDAGYADNPMWAILPRQTDITYIPPADTTPPVISNVTANSTSSPTVRIDWSTDEDSDSQVEYGTTPSFGQSTTLTDTGLGMTNSHSVYIHNLLPTTLYYFRVKSKDAPNNLATGSTYTFTTLTPPDTTPPSVSITSPSNNQSVSGVITVNVNASDTSGISNVRFFIDGSEFDVVSVAPYRATINTSGLSNGNHLLTARALDTAGNSATTPQIRIIVNNAPPPNSQKKIVINLQGNPQKNVPGNIGFFNSTTGLFISELNFTSNNSGEYTFVIPQNLPSVVSIKVKVSGYLPVMVRSVNLADNIQDTINVPELPAGDLNDDEIINSIDFSAISRKWNSASQLHDLNRDGRVDGLDYEILIGNWFYIPQKPNAPSRAPLFNR